MFETKNPTKSGDHAREEPAYYPGPSCSSNPLRKLIIYPLNDNILDLDEGRLSVSLISPPNSTETSVKSSYELRSPTHPANLK